MMEVGSTGTKVIVPGSDIVHGDCGRTVERTITVTVDRVPDVNEVKHGLRPQVVIGDADGGRVAYIDEIGVLWMGVDNGEGAQRDEDWVDLG